MNQIAVSDNRGGTFGWSLTASMPNLTANAGANSIANSRLDITPVCELSTNSTAWDYDNVAVAPVAIPGYDATLNGPGVTAGAAQTFAGSVTLCTKSTAVNATTQTTRVASTT